MNRRDFVKFLAATAAGVAAMPEQLAAFEQYYEVNTPQIATGLGVIDEINLTGISTMCNVIRFDVYNGDKIELPLGINAFGGIMRWVAAPKAELLIPLSRVRWKMEAQYLEPFPITGSIRYIDQDFRRHTKLITAPQGTLG